MGPTYAELIDAEKTWLAVFLQEAEEEARRRGDYELTADHLGLALTRSAGPERDLLVAAGVDQLDWRDQIVRVLAWGEARMAERDGLPMSDRRSADSLTELRFTGTMAVDATVDHIVALAQDEAVANNDEVGPAHLIIALLLEGECVAAATGSWLGMTPGRIRSLAALRNERRVVAGGIPHAPCFRRGTGPMVLCGGGADDDLLARVVALAPRRSGRSLPQAVLVDLGWKTRPTSAEGRRQLADRWTSIGAHGVDSGLVDRLDAESTEACERLAEADLVWFGGGDAAPIYDRLWATPALDAIRHAHDNGALIGGISAGARVWGKGTLSDFASLGEPEPFPLFGWLENLVIFNHYFPTREQAFRRHLAAFPGCRGLAITHGGAVHVDPDGLDIRVLRTGVTGTPHVLLEGPDQPLSAVKG